jgi:hypothetical protein
MKQAYHGVVDGVIRFDSSGHKLQITPGSAGEDTVIPLQKSSAPTSGNYRFSFKGETTTILPFNATVVEMASALQALLTVRNYPGGTLTVSCQVPLDDTDSVNNPESFVRFLGREVPEQVYVLNEGLSDAGSNPVSVETQKTLRLSSSRRPGRDGFTSGIYDVDCYALVYQDHHSKNGKITTETF